VGPLPMGPAAEIDLSPSRALPSNNAVVMVTRALTRAMGIAHPLVFVAEHLDERVAAYTSPAPALVVGRRIAAQPADPASRDEIGRALLRLSTGGDALHHHATPEQVHGILVALANAAGVDVEVPEDFDWDFAGTIADGLPSSDDLADLHDTAVAFRDSGERFDPWLLASALAMAEDRAGAICAGDPRPALARVFEESADPARGRMLAGYLISDDHLNLRGELGYHLDADAPASPQPREARG
jgi:hypothetical protein